MDRPEEEITKKGDQYAKRLLVRKKDLNQSFESFSKSLRRRKKIMDAISKRRMTPVAAKPASNKAELANSDDEEEEEQEEAEKSYVSTWPEQPAAALETCRDPSEPDELNLHPRRSSSQFRRDFLAGLLHHAPVHLSQACSPTKLQPKISLGEYFGAKSHKEMREANFLSDHSAAHRKAKQQQKRQLELMSARVLEILEPEVVHVERESSNQAPRGRRASDIKFIRDNFPSAPPEPAGEADSTLTSFVSETAESRELDRHAEKLHNCRPSAPQLPPETPKTSCVYPSLSSMERRMSDRCYNVVTKQLDFENAEPLGREQCNADESFDAVAVQGVTRRISDETFFATPMLMTDSNQLDGPGQSTRSGSFSRANRSFLCDNVHLPRARRKPDLESTRKPQQLSASQQGTSISTLTLPNTPSSPYCPRANEAATPAMPSEVENFLKLALGEEYRGGDVSSVSTSVQDYSTPKTMTTATAAGIQPKAAKHSGALNRSLTIYKSFSSSIKRRFKARGKREPRLAQRHGCDEEEAAAAARLQPQVKRLLDLMEVYQTQIYQASKALDLCKAMREFQASTERVEVERLLLMASLGKLATREQIRRLGDRSTAASRPFCELAELTIAELSVPLREDLLRRRERLQGGASDCVEWFVIVVSEGLRVWASPAVACPLSDTRVNFPGRLSLPDIAPSFRLSVSVYSMRLQWPSLLYNHEDKYHIEPDDAEALERSWPCPCPSPQRLLGAKSPSAKPAVRSPKQYHVGFSGIKQSAFLLCASLELSLEQLDPPRSSWALRQVVKDDEDSVLQASLDMELRCRLRLSVRHAGFLTLGDAPGGVIDWSRRWCVLEGRSLLFWNYPREQEDNKPPRHAIDLLDCLSRRVELVERSLCPRPRTLLIETARRRSPDDEDSMVFHCRRSWTIVRNLLSCDTQRDLNEWQSNLNHVVSALRDWNLVPDTEFLQVSDL